MPVDLVGDIVRVTLAWQYPDSQIEENNIAFRCSASGGSDSRAALGGAVYSGLALIYAPAMGPSSSGYGWKVTSLNKTTPPLPESLATPSPGTGVDPNCPTQARPILRLRTALSGRKYRGRLFLPTPDTTRITNGGYPTPGLLTIIGTFGAALLVPVNVLGSTWIAIIAHLVPGNPPATTYDDIVSTAPSGLFGTQRRSGNTGRINSIPW
jgi:hypothetical protein